MKIRQACKVYGYSKHYYKKYRPNAELPYNEMVRLFLDIAYLFTDREVRAYLRITRFYKNYKQ